MKKGSTLVLRAAVTAIALVVLAICVFVLPIGIKSDLEGDIDYAPILIGMYVSTIPLYLALYQTMKLLNYIDKGRVFNESAAIALGVIKKCGLTISALYAAGMPYIFYVADRDDAPGVAAIGFIIIGASFVVAMAAAVFQRLLQAAIDIKSENDLTV